MSKQTKKAYRTTMPEILAPGTGLSPATNKSVMPFNNVHTILDVLNGKKYQVPGAGGDWGDWSRDERSQPGSFKDNGDLYKRRERDLEIFNNLSNNSDELKEVWKLKVKGGYKTFPSLESAQRYRRKMEDKGIFVSWITRTAQSLSVNQVDEALKKTFIIESKDFNKNIQETGSAFCVGNGYFLTCAHVVMNYNKNTESSLDFSKYSDMIKVSIINENKPIDAQVIAFDGSKDLALLKADINVDPFIFDSSVDIGEEIFAVGSPHGFENNVTFGHVSSSNRKIYFHEGAPLYMFVDLAILPGNSGGPIVNRETGNVIGVVTAIVGENDNYGLNAGIMPSYAINFCEDNGIKVIK